jgi:hypothetical protein
MGVRSSGADDYRGSHQPPDRDYGASLDNLTALIPEDVYGPAGPRLYGIGDPEIDKEAFNSLRAVRGKPDAEVTIYRAVPENVSTINEGDWVTTSRKYADLHGERTLDGNYKIIEQKAKAGDLLSEGYPYEFGYRPSDLAALTAKAQTETPEFKNWFGNSAITSSLEPNGKPRRLYHITPKNFDAFDVNRPDAVGPMSAESGPVIFMSDDPKKQPAAHNVGGFEGKFKEGANVMPVYASIQNPLFIDSTSEAAERARFNLGRNWPYLYTREDVSKLQDAGYDGVFLTGQYGPNEIVAFRPEQVKSAIGNEGTFDPTNPVITKAKGGAVTKNNVERMRNDNSRYLG